MSFVVASRGLPPRSHPLEGVQGLFQHHYIILTELAYGFALLKKGTEEAEEGGSIHQAY